MGNPRQRNPKDILPSINWDSIAPPYREYSYFDGIEHYPFRHDAQGFDMVNAWWLIEASILAYAEKDFALPIFLKAKLPDVKFFSNRGTQCYVANNDDVVLVVFRGTEIRQRPGRHDFRNIIEDIATDADIKLVDSLQGGKVHRGFMEALDRVWEEAGLVNHIRSLDTPDRTVWFAGHSLGAALATLAAGRYGNARGLYTFGSPRVGNSEFANCFHVNTYRFVNNNDIVARVPPPGLYQHIGELKYIDNEGHIHDNPTIWEMMTDSIQGNLAHIVDSLGQFMSGRAGLLPDHMIDHVPTLYATHIWNCIP